MERSHDIRIQAVHQQLYSSTIHFVQNSRQEQTINGCIAENLRFLTTSRHVRNIEILKFYIHDVNQRVFAFVDIIAAIVVWVYLRIHVKPTIVQPALIEQYRDFKLRQIIPHENTSKYGEVLHTASDSMFFAVEAFSSSCISNPFHLFNTEIDTNHALLSAIISLSFFHLLLCCLRFIYRFDYTRNLTPSFFHYFPVVVASLSVPYVSFYGYSYSSYLS